MNKMFVLISAVLLIGCVNLPDETKLASVKVDQKTVYCDPFAETNQGVIVLCDNNKLMLEQDGEIVPIDDGQLELTSDGVRLKD